MTALGACQLTPLYGTGPVGAEVGTVAVAPVTTRVAQQVRNELIETLGRPRVAEPLVLTLSVSTVDAEFLRSQALNRATRGSARVDVAYALRDGPHTVAQGTERGIAQYDVPTQVFARQRAARDAENRAARLAAQRVRLAIAPTLATGAAPLSAGASIETPPERDPE